MKRVFRANPQNSRPSKTALLSHFVAPAQGSPDKLAQNHRFFWGGEFAGCLFSFIFSFCFVSCGYHWTSHLTYVPTISVSFVEGDGDGSLTHAIVQALASSGEALVTQKGAHYRLWAKIVDSRTETVGYRRDRQKISGKIKKNLVGAEGRKTLILEVILYERDSDKILYGPVRLDSDSDYDYLDGDSMQDLAFIDPKGVQQTVLPFSLGQLEPREAAQEATTKSLNAKIAKKVVDAIFDVWYTSN